VFECFLFQLIPSNLREETKKKKLLKKKLSAFSFFD